MKIKILVPALLIFFSTTLFAQKATQYDVYLKNGSLVRGKIVELTSEQVKISLGKDVVSSFSMNEVDKVVPVENNSAEKEKREALIKAKGFFNETEFGALVGSGTNDDKFTSAFSFQNVSGYQVNRYFKVGGGVGVDYYNEYSHTFIPLFARVSGDMVKFRVTPVYFADAGYGFLAEKDQYTNGSEELSSSGGLMLHGGLGLKFYTASKISISLLAGYKAQFSSREYYYTWNEGYSYNEDRVYRRFSFRLGICF